MAVDFHMHSTYSDGIESPDVLLKYALDSKLSFMALTDHDEIDGIRALREAKTMYDTHNSIKLISGCEFSGDYKGKSIHILGYNFDEENRELCDFLTYFKAKREERIDEIINRFNIGGYHITKERLVSLFPNTKSYGRPHVGKLLVEAGYARDINDVFKRLLHSDSPYYVPKVKVEVPYIIELIHNAGGYAVLAHPKLINNDEYVHELLTFDFDGVEAYHSKHDDTDVERYLSLAQDKGLFITGGSDYHGIPGKMPEHFGEYVISEEAVSKFISLL